MERRIPHHYLDNISITTILLCYILFNVIPCCCNQAPSMRCSQVEREALLKFKRSLNDPSNRLRSWAGDDCCNWAGIRCDNRTRRVIRLDVRNPHPFSLTSYYENNHRDPVYAKSCLVGQEVNPSLLDLKHLKYLDLSRNNFSGIPIPNFFGSFLELRYLSLSSSFFGGVVPHHLGNLSNLRSLDLNLVEDYGPYDVPQVRVNNLQWVSGLSHLKHLDMSFVNLSQASNPVQAISFIPHLLELHLHDCGISQNLQLSISNPNFTSLVALTLSRNDFHGPLPNFIQNMTSLQGLELSMNSFNGTIHHDLSHLCNMEILNLQNNKLSGEIHKLFQNSSSSKCFKNSKLEELDLSHNPLSGHVPDWLGQLKNLRRLYLLNNSFVGPPPPSLWKLSSLESLYLVYNKFNGSIPESLGQLSHLENLDLSSNFFEGALSNIHFANLTNLMFLYLSSNNFVGPLPCLPSNAYAIDVSHNFFSGPIHHIGVTFPNLYVLVLSNNSFTGTIPHSLCEMKSLQILDLSMNHLSRHIPQCLGNLQQLVVLDLSSNNISGTIPSSLSKLFQLTSLHLSMNKFHGQIPLSLINCTSLITLDLGENKLSGSVPTWIGENLSSLKFLKLRQNKMNGIIPLQLCHLTRLQVLDLAHNNISGTIPRCFSKFSGMVLNQSIGNWSSQYALYIDKITVISSGRESEYTRTLPLVTGLDLSNNNLVGVIHEELMILSALRSLNLSKNKFEGIIPEKIGEMISLESLDLSENKLSGRIPQSMSRLTSLSHLNLSYNKLSGTIPSGYQLQTLTDPSIYIGNPGLCGAPLKSCQEPHVVDGIKSEKTKNSTLEINWFYIGMACGHTVGFWGVCGVLFFNKPSRVAYFHFLNGVKDWLLVKIAMNAAQLKRRLMRNQVDG